MWLCTILSCHKRPCCDRYHVNMYLTSLERQTLLLSINDSWLLGCSVNSPLKSVIWSGCCLVYCSAYYPWLSLERMGKTTKGSITIHVPSLQPEKYTGILPNIAYYRVTATIEEKMLLLEWKCFLNNHQRHIYRFNRGGRTAVCTTNSNDVVNKGQFVITQCTAWSIV